MNVKWIFSKVSLKVYVQVLCARLFLTFMDFSRVFKVFYRFFGVIAFSWFCPQKSSGFCLLLLSLAPPKEAKINELLHEPVLKIHFALPRLEADSFNEAFCLCLGCRGWQWMQC